MEKNLVARAATTIDAPTAKVWDALVNPDAIKEYFFGTEIVTDWQEGSSILWKGEWKGKSYEDVGKVIQVEPGRILQYSHFSPQSGLPDEPENYHTVTVELSEDGRQTRVSLTQDNNPSDEARRHSEENWEMMLSSLKVYVER